MIKATIVTPYKRYDFEVPAENGPSIETAYDWISSQVFGHSGVIRLPGRIIELGTSDVKGIEIWEEATLLEMATKAVNMASLQISDAEPGEFTDQVEFLGRQLRLRLITYTLRGYTYVLPHEIDGEPALEVIDPDTLGMMAEHLMQRIGQSATVILPPAQLSSDKEAQEYVMDYAEQATPPAYFSPGDKTAAAYWGLRKDG